MGLGDVTQVRVIKPHHVRMLAGQRLRWEIIQKHVPGGVFSASAAAVSCLPAGIWAHWEGGTGGTGKHGGWLRELCWWGGVVCCCY